MTGLLKWLLLSGCLLAGVANASEAAGSATDGVPGVPAELRVANRTIITLQATLLGETPASRVQRAAAVIDETLQGTDDLQVRIDPILNSQLVILAGRRAFIVAPQDLGGRAAIPARPPSGQWQTCSR